MQWISKITNKQNKTKSSSSFLSSVLSACNQWLSLKFYMFIANDLKFKLGIYKNCAGRQANFYGLEAKKYNCYLTKNFVTTRVGLKIAVKDEPIFLGKGGFSQKRLRLQF